MVYLSHGYAYTKKILIEANNEGIRPVNYANICKIISLLIVQHSMTEIL